MVLENIVKEKLLIKLFSLKDITQIWTILIYNYINGQIIKNLDEPEGLDDNNKKELGRLL